MACSTSDRSKLKTEAMLDSSMLKEHLQIQIIINLQTTICSIKVRAQYFEYLEYPELMSLHTGSVLKFFITFWTWKRWPSSHSVSTPDYYT